MQLKPFVFQGTIKQTMSLAEQEGIPISIDICGHYLVIATDNGFVKGWDISRRSEKFRVFIFAFQSFEINNSWRFLQFLGFIFLQFMFVQPLDLLFQRVLYFLILEL